MEIGSVVRLRTIQHEHENGNVSLTFKAPSGDVFVLMVLGIEPRKVSDAEAIIPDDVLVELGWSPPKKKG